MENLIKKVLNNYGLENSQVSFLRHNENYTCQVINKEHNKYLLRVHKPVEGFSISNVQHSYDALNSELSFIDAISQNTDIIVQKPIKNIYGSYVTKIIDDNDNNINASLLSWIDGHTMNHEDPNWEEQAYYTGIMVGKLHKFSKEWSNEHKLSRVNYDKNKVFVTLNMIEKAIALSLVTENQFQIIEKGCSKIVELMIELDKLKDQIGYIHADIQRTNLIVHNKTISPIDFSLCGYGYFFMDLGGVSADFGPLNIRKALLDGYNSVININKTDMKYIEAFFVYTILLGMSNHLYNPRYKEWFLRRTKVICESYIKPLINNERFYELI